MSREQAHRARGDAARRHEPGIQLRTMRKTDERSDPMRMAHLDSRQRLPVEPGLTLIPLAVVGEAVTRAGVLDGEEVACALLSVENGKRREAVGLSLLVAELGLEGA